MIAAAPSASRTVFGQSSFAIRLAALRKRRGWSRDDLGRAIGVTERIVGYWETGGRQPIAENLERLADLFGVSMGELWRGRP
jgi:transcriptional regulator with XRE-family HTH domain